MKTNMFKSSVMAFALLASFSACTQNEELGTAAPTGEDALNVVAYSNEFVSSDAESRVSNTGYNTTFEKDDAIGVFVVRDGQALVSNMKMTLNADNAWTGDNDAPLYYYKDADYIAYYPYTKDLKATSVNGIVTYFTDKVGTEGQATLAEYEATDLMLAEVKSTDVNRGEALTFNLAHKMSMIEVKVPVRAYTTTDGTFTYKAPLGLQVNAGGNTMALCCVGSDAEAKKDIYRCIVAPSETPVQIDGQFQDGSLEVYFPNNETKIDVTPEAGKYKGININYNYGEYESVRDLKVGDYYYADGSIYPVELPNTPEIGCVGVIFSTETSETDKGHGWSHGYVIALNNTGESTIKWKNVNTVDEGYDVFDIDDENKDASFQAMIDYLDGYTSSKKITETSNEATHPAFFAAKNYNVSISETTSGWYLPSMGQLAALVNNLGVTDESKKFTSQNCSEKASNPKFDENGEDAPAVIERIDAVFKKVGGSLRSEMDITESGWNLRWWGCGQTSFDTTTPNGKAWCVDMNYGTNDKNVQYAKFLFLSRDKTDGTDYNRVRPVFAF